MSEFKSGFVTIIGRPNVGKSTLLNALLGEKISIISSVPQTTRYAIRGILNTDRAQIVFVDTPGVHLYKDKLSSDLNVLALQSLEDVEVVLYVVDCTRMPHREEERIMRALTRHEGPICMLFNKMDKSKKYVNDYIDMWHRLAGKENSFLKYFLPISALYGKNKEKLLELILDMLPQGEPFYDKNTVTDFPLSYRVADVIREKLCVLLKEELPHSVAVEVKEIDDQEERLARIRADILIARKSQKRIVVGHKGEMLKEIGTRARVDLEVIFGKKVFLELWVTLEKDWQDKPRVLRELGYTGT